MLRQPTFWAILLVCAGLFAAVYLLLGQTETAALQPLEPAPVAAGDQEVAWLNPATNLYAWTRFLAGLQLLANQRPVLGLTIDDQQAFPNESTKLPAIGIKRTGHVGTLWLRWHKLTGQQGTSEWMDALMKRSPPPVAVVGGGSSDRARDAALALGQFRRLHPDPPVLLFTSATAETVWADGQPRELMSLYEGRCFRFSFTNRQMADLLLDFIWQEPNLRPAEGCAYLLAWKDDPYSLDCLAQFRRRLRRHLDGDSTAADLATPDLPQVRRTWERLLPHSIGPLFEPNGRETAAVQELIQDLAEGDEQERALLVLPAELKPARRVLRTLCRNAPASARRFIVTPGDTINFNAIYRDRRAQWPIQELPCPLAVFCHHDPVNEGAGFAAESESLGRAGVSPSGTEDLLLYANVGAALAEAAFEGGRLVASPNVLQQRLRRPIEPGGKPEFDAAGNRMASVGAHVVLLEPKWAGERALPQASLSVYSREGAGASWALQRRLAVEYAPATPAGERGPS